MDNMYESFLSHAGEQKWLCVEFIHDQLEAIKNATKTTDGRDLEVFFDDRSLRPGDDGWARIEEAAAGCRTAVVVLSREFVRKSACMEELAIFLRRAIPTGGNTPDTATFHIIPVFLGLTFDDCYNKLREQYDTEPWIVQSEAKPDSKVLDTWASNVKKLCKFTGRRRDQAAFSKGQMAAMVVEDIVGLLKKIGRLPEGFEHQKPVLGPFAGGRVMKEVVGRDREVADVVLSVLQDKLVQVVGPPGEGKTHVAMDAAEWLYHCGRVDGGVYCIDFAGFATASEDLKDFVAAQMYSQHGPLRHEQMSFMRSPGWPSLVAWLKAPKPGPVLLVLDNVEDVLDAQPAAAGAGGGGVHGTSKDPDEDEDEDDALWEASGEAQLKAALKELCQIEVSTSRKPLEVPGARKAPAAPRAARIIMASRKPMTCEVHADFPQVEVHIGALHELSSKGLLLLAAGDKVQWPDEFTIRKLAVDVCRCNALALVMIGGFLRLGRCGPQEATKSFQDMDGRLKDTVPRDRDQGLLSNTSTQLRADHRVHRHWIQQYLTEEELHYLTLLSVFRGSFDLGGAAFIARSVADACGGTDPAAASSSSGAAASAAGGADAQAVKAIVENLQHVSVLQRVSGNSDARRFSMHLLLRELGGDRLKLARYAPARRAAQCAFAKLMVWSGQRLARVDPYAGTLGDAEAAATVACGIIADEARNMLQLPWVLGLDALQDSFRDDGFAGGLNELATVLNQRGMLHTATRIAAAAARRAGEVRGQDDEHAASAKFGSALMQMMDGNGRGSVAQLRELLEQAQHRPHDPRTLIVQRMLALALCASGGAESFEEAEGLLRGLADLLLQGGDENAGDVLCDLVSALQAQDNMEDAEVVYITAKEVGGLSDMGRYRLQAFLAPQNRMQELQQLFATAQHGGRESGRGGRLLEPMAESMLAAAPYGRQHALQSAGAALEELRAVWRPGHVQEARVLVTLARSLAPLNVASLGIGRPGQGGPASLQDDPAKLRRAEDCCRQAINMWESAQDRAASLQTADARMVLGRVLMRQGIRLPEAEAEVRRAVAAMEGVMEPGHASLCKYLMTLAVVVMQQVMLGGEEVLQQQGPGLQGEVGVGYVEGRLEEARELLERAKGMLVGFQPDVDAEFLECCELLGKAWMKAGQVDRGADASGLGLQVVEERGAGGGMGEGQLRAAYGSLWLKQAVHAEGEADGYLALAQMELAAAKELLGRVLPEGHPEVVQVAEDAALVEMMLG